MNLLSSHFQTAKQSADAIRDHYFELQRELQEIISESRAVRVAPAHRSDVAKAIDNWIQRTGAAFEARLSERLASLPALQGGELLGTKDIDVGYLASSSHAADSVTVGDIDGALCALAGHELRLRFMVAIARMERPREGLPLAERAQKLGELADRERNVREQIAALVKEADEAGIELAHRPSLG